MSFHFKKSLEGKCQIVNLAGEDEEMTDTEVVRELTFHQRGEVQSAEGGF